jgi:ATP-dependent Clp protease protease subunit
MFRKSKLLRKVTYDNVLKKIYFRDNITFNSISKMIKFIDNEKKTCKKIDLHITSNGGDCCAGLLGYDILKLSKIPIHTHCEGLVASSGSILFLGGKQRFMTKNSFMLIHQLSVEHFSGKHYEIHDFVLNTNLIMEKMKNIYLTETQIELKNLESLLKRDLYLDSQECLQYKFIDKIEQ